MSTPKKNNRYRAASKEGIIIDPRARGIKDTKIGIMAKLRANKGDEAATKEVEAKGTTAAEASSNKASNLSNSLRIT